MIRIEKFKKPTHPELARQAFQVRNIVFVEEQMVDPALEYDEFEDIATHYLLYYNDIPVVTARWRKTDKGIKLERFATLKEYRFKKLGDAILGKILSDVKEFDLPVYLHSQLKAVSFYERRGFVKEGEIFVEADIEHYMMKLR
ncbi:GNAT family N-acetyltransferase [Bacteroidota bacterium]